jgi:hypothetical protein
MDWDAQNRDFRLQEAVSLAGSELALSGLLFQIAQERERR